MKKNIFNVENWKQTKPSEKVEFFNELITKLGSSWELVDNAFKSKVTDELFSFIPGGWMKMGFSITDIFLLCLARGTKVDDISASWQKEIKNARPATNVYVYPFLMAQHCSENKEIPKPFHLPSEAEMEWVLRNSGQSAFFGVDLTTTVTKANRGKLVTNLEQPYGLHNISDPDSSGHLCEDSFHATYHKRPINSFPWGHDQEVNRTVHTMWQDDTEELIGWHAAYRLKESSGKVRATFRLHEILNGSDLHPDVMDEDHTALLEGLESEKGPAYIAAWSALYLLTFAPDSDVIPLLNSILPKLPKADPKDLEKYLEWIYHLSYGHYGEEITRGIGEFEQGRIRIRKFLSTKADTLVSFLSHKKIEVRTQAALAVAACNGVKEEVLDEFFLQYKKEKANVVKESIVLGAALLYRGSHPTALLSEFFKNADVSEEIKTLATGIIGNVQVDAIIKMLDDGDNLKRTDWFVALLKSNTTDKGKIAQELAYIALSKNMELKYRLLRAAFEMLFECFPPKPMASIMPNGFEPYLLPHELTSDQRAYIKIIDGEHLQFADEYRIPNTAEGRRILLGVSNNKFARLIDYEGRKIPIYFMINQEVYKKGDVKDFLLGLPLVELMELYKDFNKVGWPYMHTWPYHYGNKEPLIDEIRTRVTEQRKKLCEWLVPILEDHFSTDYLAMGYTVENTIKKNTALFFIDCYKAAANEDDPYLERIARAEQNESK